MTDFATSNHSFQTRRGLALLAGLIFGAIGGFGLSSMAENTELDTGTRLLPYRGVLDLDGMPYSGTMDIQVTLVDDGDHLWSEEHEDVFIEAGRFGVNIGESAGAVPNWVFDASAVYIKLAIREGSGQEQYLALSGLQQLEVVPYTYWAAEGHDTRIERDAWVQGDLTVEGSATVELLEGDLTATQLSPSAEALNITGRGGAGGQYDDLLLLEGGGRLVAERVGEETHLVFDLNEGDFQFTDGSANLQLSQTQVDVSELKVNNLTIDERFTINPQHVLNGSSNGNLIEFRGPFTTAGQIELGTPERRFCALSESVDNNSTVSSCRIFLFQGTYRLQATGGTCTAMCITW